LLFLKINISELTSNPIFSNILEIPVNLNQSEIILTGVFGVMICPSFWGSPPIIEVSPRQGDTPILDLISKARKEKNIFNLAIQTLRVALFGGLINGNCISINFDFSDILDPNCIISFANDVDQLGLDRSKLIIEVLENMWGAQCLDQTIINLVKGLLNQRFYVAFDDFGSEVFSNFPRLKIVISSLVCQDGINGNRIYLRIDTKLVLEESTKTNLDDLSIKLKEKLDEALELRRLFGIQIVVEGVENVSIMSKLMNYISMKSPGDLRGIFFQGYVFQRSWMKVIRNAN